MASKQTSDVSKEDGLRLLRQLIGPTPKIGVDKLTSTNSPARRFGAPALPEAAAAPYVVWLDNRTAVNLDIEVAWAQLNVSGVQRTGGVVFAGQVAPFILGGADGCATVYAYVLVVRYQGQYIGDTGVRQPDASDGDACSDAYAVGGG